MSHCAILIFKMLAIGVVYIGMCKSLKIRSDRIQFGTDTCVRYSTFLVRRQPYDVAIRVVLQCAEPSSVSEATVVVS